MKNKNIFFTFISASVAATAFCTANELLCIDGKTGFIISDMKTLSVTLTVITLLVALVCCVCSFFAREKSSENIPKNIPLIILSLLIGLLTVADAFVFRSSDYTPGFLKGAIYISSALAAIFFVTYFVAALFAVEISKFSFAVPLLYYAIRLIRIFAKMTSVTLIFNHAFSLLASCAAVLFFLQFAKYANGFIGEKENKKTLCYASLCATFSFGTSVPQIVKYYTDSAPLQEDAVSLLVHFVTGIFALCFVYACFVKEQAE